MVPGRGLEPPRLTAREPKSRVATSFTIRACMYLVAEIVGFEPTERFLVRQVSNLLLSTTQPYLLVRDCLFVTQGAVIPNKVEWVE